MPVEDFDLEQTLECGQCFNFEKLADHEYIVVAKGKMLHVRQRDGELKFLNASRRDVDKIWVPYFDLERDYSYIKKAVVSADPALKDVVKKYHGVRILDQDYAETLFSFIISQNKNIPHIKQIVRNISMKYGHKVGEVDIRYCDRKQCGPEIKRALDEGDEGRDYFSFPDVDVLKTIGEEGFREMKTGFRAAYLKDAAEKLCGGECSSKNLYGLGYNEAKEKLMQIKGVGDKVANCVLLFSLGFRNAFPVDVWIYRIMDELYHDEMAKISGTDKNGKISKAAMEEFAASKFGEYGGYAQQYLFIYAREK